MDKTFYKQLVDTAENAGIKIVSDDKCCKILAWVYAYGGSIEDVTQNLKFQEDILIAQKRLNVYGGEIVTPELFILLKKYLSEVHIMPSKDKVHPDWVYEICECYNIKKNLIN